MALDLARARADTPGCANVVHLNNAGSALPPQAVVERVIEHLRLEAAVGGYEARNRMADALTATHTSLEALLHAGPGTVAITQSDTAAWTKTLWGLAFTGWFDGGGRVLVDAAAYNSHYLALLQLRERVGITIEQVAASPTGEVDLADLARRLDHDVRLVTATHMGTHRGLVNPVADIGRLARDAGVPFFLDACQSTGQLPVDVAAIGCAVATGTGRKFLRAPRGTGFAYVAPTWAERLSPPGIDGMSAMWVDAEHYTLQPGAARLAEFEASYATHLGLGTAVDYALAVGIDAIAERVTLLAETLRDRLGALGAAIHDGGQQRGAIVTFTLADVSPYDIQRAAAAAGVNIAVTEAPWARLDMEQRGLSAAARASVHYYNDDADLDALCAVVEGL
jgi:selenocysteine lyase/cysteine desulfurase